VPLAPLTKRVWVKVGKTSFLVVFILQTESATNIQDTQVLLSWKLGLRQNFSVQMYF